MVRVISTSSWFASSRSEPTRSSQSAAADSSSNGRALISVNRVSCSGVAPGSPSSATGLPRRRRERALAAPRVRTASTSGAASGSPSGRAT